MTKDSDRFFKPLTGKERQKALSNICIDTGFLLSLSNGNKEAINYFTKVLTSKSKFVFIPTAVISEFYHTSHQYGHKNERIEEILNQMNGISSIEKVKLCEEIAKESGLMRVRIKNLSGFADSVIVSTARKRECYTILTSDKRHLEFLRSKPYFMNVVVFKT